MANYLVTGAAGFIASKVCEFLLAEGHTVVGVDNLNDYYDVRLKDYRLSMLLGAEGKEQRAWGKGLGNDPKKSVFANHQSPLTNSSGTFTFHHLDIENLVALDALFGAHPFTAVFNLAARAGVRYSMENPHVYLSTNTLGTLNLLECMRKHGVKKQVLASTSSLYAGCPMPFTEDLPVNTPLSPYAATKKGAELMAYSYHKLYGLDTTVVRYFTVFGPAGRPDMSIFRFIHWIDREEPIELFGDGSQSRDFTYVDDIARGTILAGRLFGGKLLAPGEELGKEQSAKGKAAESTSASGASPQAPSPSHAAAGVSPLALSPSPSAGFQSSGFEILNLGGGNNPISLNTVIAFIENALNAHRAQSTKSKAQSDQPSAPGPSPYAPVRARITGKPFHVADIKETWADISKAARLLGWKPQVSPQDGFQKTVDWYLENRSWLKDIRL